MLVFTDLDLPLPPEMTPLPPLLTIARWRPCLDDGEDLEVVVETLAAKKPELVLFVPAALCWDYDLDDPEEADEANDALFGANWLSDAPSLVLVDRDDFPLEDDDPDDDEDEDDPDEDEDDFADFGEDGED